MVSHPRIFLHTHCCYKLQNSSRSLQNLIQQLLQSTTNYHLSFMLSLLHVSTSTKPFVREAIYIGTQIQQILSKIAMFFQQNSLYLYSFVHNLPDNGFVEAETYGWDIVNNKRLFIVDCPNCWIKYHTFILLHGIWSTLNSHPDNCSETQAHVVAYSVRRNMVRSSFISK